MSDQADPRSEELRHLGASNLSAGESEVPMGARVDLLGVRRCFDRGSFVVDGINLTIKPGEFVSLLGPSGCGKSTLLRLIAGLDRPDAGTLRVDSFGREFFRGFVFQEASLLPWRNVIDNTSLPLILMGSDKREARDRAAAALAAVGLSDAELKYPRQLSGGMKMRVSVARALVAKPSLLLLDEPFASLDENTRHRLQEDLRALWERLQMTTVFVTHSVSEAVFLSNRAIVLSTRPARILLDHGVELASPRPPKVRTSSAFIKQMDAIYEAFRYEGQQKEDEAP